MRHAVALSSSVNVIGKEAFLSKEVIRCEQETDELCSKYRGHENFCTDEYGILYRQGPGERPRVAIPVKLVHTVLAICHELSYTAHQCVRETRVIGRKYWWETLRDDVSAFIINLMSVQKWKTGRRSVAPLGDILVAQEFLVITSLEIV
jgi:hypothetical protein